MSYDLINPILSGALPGTFNGLQIIVVDAQQQQRTPTYRTDTWIRPGRVPSKLHGRRGTRRAWKRKHQPHWLWAYEEPTDVLQFGRKIIVTPQQEMLLKKAAA